SFANGCGWTEAPVGELDQGAERTQAANRSPSTTRTTTSSTPCSCVRRGTAEAGGLVPKGTSTAVCAPQEKYCDEFTESSGKGDEAHVLRDTGGVPRMARRLSRRGGRIMGRVP